MEEVRTHCETKIYITSAEKGYDSVVGEGKRDWLGGGRGGITKEDCSGGSECPGRVLGFDLVTPAF